MVQHHLQEREIDILASAPESLGEEQRISFRRHIAGCSLCGEHYTAALEFHSALNENLEREPSSREKDLAHRISRAGSDLMLAFRGLQRSGSLPDAVAEITDLKPGLAARLVRFAVAHPVRAGASFAGIAALTLFLVTTFRGVEPKSPEYVKVQDGLMSVYDADGDVIWTKRVRGVPDGSSVSGFFNPVGRLLDGVILIDDIHSKPGNEVVVLSASRLRGSKRDFSADTVYCFDANGGLMWTQSYRPAVFGLFADEKRGKWNISRMFTTRLSDGMDRLFVLAYNSPFSPSALMEIDGATGLPLQTYTHFGYMTQIAVAGPGDKARIIAAGINNSFNQVFVAVLEPSALQGLGPTGGDFNRGDALRSAEMYYLLFPRSELSQKLSIYPYNGVQTPITTLEDGSFVLTIDEFDAESDSLTGNIVYSFDKDLRLKSVTFSDPLLRTYELVSGAGKKFTPLDDEYAKSLAAKIRYWDGDRFVSMPTPNRRYDERMNLP